MPSLFLCADEPGWAPVDATEFRRHLQTLGLLRSGAGTAADEALRPGPRFSGLITFLGCSPRIVVEEHQAGEGETACFVRVHRYPDVRFIGAPNARVRCPTCRVPAGDTRSRSHDTPYHCRHCGSTVAFSALDWRQSAGFGRCFVEIGAIWPHEAVPSDRLMNRLQAYSHTAWKFFYAD